MKPGAHQDIAEALRGILEGFPGWSDVELQDDDRAEYRVQARVRGISVAFLLELKRAVWKAEESGKARERSFNLQMPIVLGSASIPARCAHELREQGVNYLDTAGNAFLDLPGLHVFRESNGKPLIDPRPKRPAGSVFNASAVRVGLQLLLDPTLVGSNMRNMAALAGVSAPSVKFALDAFKAGGYVVDAGRRGRRLLEREAFFRKWVESYNQSYRPHRILGRYAAGRQQLSLEGFEACWGGEVGADRITQAIRPAEQVVYCYARKVGPLIVGNRLRPDPDGGVQFFESCWSRNQEEPQGTAPALILYADLLNTADPRCLEVAERIFETIIKERLHAGR